MSSVSVSRNVRRARRSSVSVVVGAAVACMLMAAGCSDNSSDTGDGGSSEPVSTALHGAVRDPLPDVSALTLPIATDPTQSFSFQPAPGTIQLVYFGYTACPDVCPTTLADIRAALRDLGPDADRVQVVFGTIDPTRDTAEIAEGYVTSFIPNAVAVRTEDDAVLRPVAQTFGVSYDTDYSNPDEPKVAHSGFTYVVNDQGKLVVQWAFGTKSPEMRDDIETLLAASSPSPS